MQQKVTNGETNMNRRSRQTTRRPGLLSSVASIGIWALPILVAGIVGLLTVDVRSAPKAAAAKSSPKKPAAKSAGDAEAGDAKAEQASSDGSDAAAAIKLPDQMFSTGYNGSYVDLIKFINTQVRQGWIDNGIRPSDPADD